MAAAPAEVPKRWVRVPRVLAARARVRARLVAQAVALRQAVPVAERQRARQVRPARLEAPG